MNYTESTPSYNERRYGKPWMAKLTTSLTKDFEFIDWDGRPGSAGEFNFSAEPGTLLAYGQKDIRKGRGGVDGYQICMPDGSLPKVSDTSVMELRKLPTSDRPKAFARIVITHREQFIAEMPEAKLSEAYYRNQVADAKALIEKYQQFLDAKAVGGAQ